MIKLSVPDIGMEELEEIKKVFDTKYLVQGDRVEEFEDLIKGYLNVRHAIAVSSGTAALHLALVALDIKASDEVIVPDYTFPATSNVVEIVGATSKFVDIELDSFCIDATKIESQITSRTKAIIPVHEFGQASNMDLIMDLSKKYNLSIIEDAACALGSEFKGKKVGTIGDIGCFSLHPRKAITTGEGGIVVTNNDDIAQRVKLLRNHGLNSINGKLQFTLPGFNYRMTNIQGAIGVAQMNKIYKINKQREEMVNYYNENLSKLPNIILPTELDYGKHVWQSYQILLDRRYDRNKIIGILKNRGIETNYGAYAVHEQPYYKEKYNYSDSHFVNSLYAHNYGLVLPLYYGLTKDDILYITSELEKVLNV